MSLCLPGSYHTLNGNEDEAWLRTILDLLFLGAVGNVISWATRGSFSMSMSEFTSMALS